MTLDAREFEDDGGGGEYGYIRTADGTLVRYSPYVGLEAVKPGQGGAGSKSPISQNSFSNLFKGNQQSQYDNPGLGSYTNSATGETTTFTSSPTTSGSMDTGYDLSGGEYSLSNDYSGASNLNTGTTIDGGSVGTFDASSGSMGDAGLGDAGSSGGSSGSESGSSGGSYMGAVIGGINGYQAGKKNAETDPKMTSGEDGFGTYHRDYRAEVGGTVGGAVIGWYGGSTAGGASGKAVEKTHPYMERFTRGLITGGEKLTGDSFGSMMLDPIGTVASGKYSTKDIIKDGFKTGTKVTILGPAGGWFNRKKKD